MTGIVNKVSFFSAHPKRHTKLEESIHQTPHPGPAELKKLKDLCRTRWVGRINALDRFKNLPCLVTCFETICNEGLSKWALDPVRCQYASCSHQYNCFCYQNFYMVYQVLDYLYMFYH